MDHVIAFFKNKWTRLGFSALSLGYGFFMIWLAWLSFSFFLVPTNPVSLFSLYLLINVLFGIVMIYTRKEIATQITACLLHPCILVMLVFAFGNWFLLVPVFVVSTVVFFAAGSPESLKTVLGTIYLILFVIVTLGYLTMQIFSIGIPTLVDLDLRCPQEDYLYSTEGTYRLVMYIDRENKENRTVSYFVEFTADDIKLPFLEGERHSNSRRILQQRLSNKTEVEWLSDSQLLIDGRVKDVSVNDGESRNGEDFFSGETEVFTQPPQMTRAETPPPDEQLLT
ncbi:MAG: hypothetical protein FWH08_00075 [Oscillospiraceae bacterium]|nr:hypothetical protein [Oscillospiraceae bacterium]